MLNCSYYTPKKYFVKSFLEIGSWICRIDFYKTIEKFNDIYNN
jgi:hypothetical protein